MSLSLDLREWIAKAQGNAEQVVRAAGIELATSVILRSPVDTGRFRGNWQVTYNAPATSTLDNLDRSGAGAIGAATNELSAYDSSIPRIWFANNLPYAYRLEYESWSSQAPAGMVRVSIAEFQSIVDEKVRELT